MWFGIFVSLLVGPARVRPTLVAFARFGAHLILLGPGTPFRREVRARVWAAWWAAKWMDYHGWRAFYEDYRGDAPMRLHRWRPSCRSRWLILREKREMFWHYVGWSAE